MAKMMISLAAAALLTALALPGTANAADTRRADGIGIETANPTDVSAQRRRKRVVRRYYRGPRYYAPRYYGDYAYSPYRYNRRYYRPYYGPGVYFGGPGISFGFR